MEALHSLIVAGVIVASVFSPKGLENHVLGTHIAEAEETTDGTTSGSLRTRIEDRQQIVEQEKEKIQTRLQEVKDDTKKKIAENLSNRFLTVNDNWVKHWTNVLDRLDTILGKLKTRVDNYTGSKDTSALKSAISNAETAVADARDAVQAQSSKTYDFQVSTDATIGQNVRTEIKTFKADVQNVWQKVKDARQAVFNVLVEVKKLTNEGGNTNEPG